MYSLQVFFEKRLVLRCLLVGKELDLLLNLSAPPLFQFGKIPIQTLGMTSTAIIAIRIGIHEWPATMMMIMCLVVKGVTDEAIFVISQEYQTSFLVVP